MLDEAAEQFEKVEVRAPDLPVVHAFLGAVFERRGEAREAFDGVPPRAAPRAHLRLAASLRRLLRRRRRRWQDRCPQCQRWNTSAPVAAPLSRSLRAVGAPPPSTSSFPALCPVCDAHARRAAAATRCAARAGSAIPRLAPPVLRSLRLAAGRTFDRATPADVVAPGAAAVRRRAAVDPPGCDYARAAAEYDGGLRDALHAFKFRGQAGAGPSAGGADRASSGRRCAARTVDALVPVPLARARERERGFNQAALLAERLAPRLGVPVRPPLARARAGRPGRRATSAAAERRANVRGAFAAPAGGGRAPRRRRRRRPHHRRHRGASAPGRCVRRGPARVGVVAVARVLCTIGRIIRAQSNCPTSPHEGARP